MRRRTTKTTPTHRCLPAACSLDIIMPLRIYLYPLCVSTRAKKSVTNYVHTRHATGSSPQPKSARVQCTLCTPLATSNLSLVFHMISSVRGWYCTYFHALLHLHVSCFYFSWYYSFTCKCQRKYVIVLSSKFKFIVVATCICQTFINMPNVTFHFFLPPLRDFFPRGFFSPPIVPNICA